MEEKIVCFESKILNRYVNKSIIFHDRQLWQDILNNLQHRPRAVIENDYRFKQLVVYSIIKSYDTYLTYKRTQKTGEKRLRKKYSLGVGGHVNIADRTQQTLFENYHVEDFIMQAVWREINEEIVIKSKIKSKPQLLCFINDDSDDVGKVHFGTIWLLHICSPEVSGRTSEGIGRLTFNDLKYLKTQKKFFEKWSQLMIDYFTAKEEESVSINRCFNKKRLNN